MAAMMPLALAGTRQPGGGNDSSATNGYAVDALGQSPTKRRRGRPKGKTKYDPKEIAKLLRDFRASGLRTIADFAREKGLDERETKRKIGAAKVAQHRVTKIVP
jgi:hypothetical protein